MKLHTDKINFIKNRLAELSTDSSDYARKAEVKLNEALKALVAEDERILDKLESKAVLYIDAKLKKYNGMALLTYKDSGINVVVHHVNDMYRVYTSNRLMMTFSTLKSLSRYLLLAEDLILEVSLKKEN